jgi:hypothetical protein
MSFDLTERITFRLSYAERRAIENAARAYGMEPTRLVRKLVAKALANLQHPNESEQLRFQEAPGSWRL